MEITEDVVISAARYSPKINKILLLIDCFTMSSAEFIFLRAVKRNKNVILIGEKTAGIVHGTMRFIVDKNYLLNLTTCKYHDEKGVLLEDMGINPLIYAFLKQRIL